MTPRPESDVRLEVRPGDARPSGRPVEARRFHVALLGDFSGRGGAAPPERLQALPVDRDEVDGRLAALAPVVRLGGGDGGGGGLEVTFRELEDFHPDRLLERVPLLRSIREAAAARVRPAPDPSAGSAPGPAPVQEMLSGSVLDRIVEGQDPPAEGGTVGEGSGPEGRRPRRSRDPLQAWVEDLVRPHLEGAPLPEAARLESRVEELLGEAMRELLRTPAFRRLEGLWRGVDFLVRRLEGGPRPTLHLVDVTEEALASEGGRAAFDDLLARGAGPDGEPWSVVAATWSVGPEPRHLVLLRELARRASAAGAVLLAGARPSLAGLPSLADAGDRAAWGEPDRLWSAFRREPEAAAVGLVLPRVLLRLPYGEETDPCERVKLEEIAGGEPSPDDYVWGAAVLPLVLVLARAFERAGPDLLDAVDPGVRGLPLHAYRAGGEVRATPCTEIALTRDDADRMMDAGIMPWAWHRGDDGIRLVRLQSAAEPLAALAGWWR